DLDLLRLITQEPRAGVREYSRRLGIARNTATSRIAKLENAGVIVGWRPQMDLAPLGYGVTSFVHVHFAQSCLEESLERLAVVPDAYVANTVMHAPIGHAFLEESLERLSRSSELIEANSVSGEGDLLCRPVARDNFHSEEILQKVNRLVGVRRVRSEIVLNR